MFGANRALGQALNDGQELWIQEIFYTLQGEGPFAGQPAVFVRTAGCNLKCFWCDTDFESSTWKPSLGEILTKVAREKPSSVDLAVITGGEPFRQNIAPLVRRMLDQGMRVQIETAGTLWVDLPEDPRLSIVCSPKTKSLHRSVVPRVNAYKYVIGAGESDPVDGLPVASTQKPAQTARLFRPPAGSTIYVMPKDVGDRDRNLENQQVCMRIALEHGYRLCLQTHKLLGLP